MKKDGVILTYEDATVRRPPWVVPAASAAAALSVLGLVLAVVWVDGRSQDALRMLQARAAAQVELAAQQQDRAAATSRALQDLADRAAKLDVRVQELGGQVQDLTRRLRAGAPPDPIARLGERVTMIMPAVEVHATPDAGSEVLARLSMNDRAVVVG
jgi:hypothetical protein